MLLCATTMSLLLVACGGDSGSTSGEKDYTSTDTEAAVTTVVKETLAESWGLEYGDFKISETACDYISESETSDGGTSYYYLFRSAYEDDFGVNHPITARAYLVKGDNTCYITYVTHDGESVHFDEETEDWLLNIG